MLASNNATTLQSFVNLMGTGKQYMRHCLVIARWFLLRQPRRLAIAMLASTAANGTQATTAFADGAAAGVTLIPMGQIGSRLNELRRADKPIQIIGNTQNRSTYVVAALSERGYTNESSVNNGVSEWFRRRLQVVVVNNKSKLTPSSLIARSRWSGITPPGVVTSW